MPQQPYENAPPLVLGRHHHESALQLGPQKRPYIAAVAHLSPVTVHQDHTAQ